MYADTSALYHVLVLFLLAMGIFSLKNLGLKTLLFMMPVLGETVQFFMPGRTPDFMDLIHGYLGILTACCLVRMWREIMPVWKKVQLRVNEKAAKSH
jgi:VanZ family protein